MKCGSQEVRVNIITHNSQNKNPFVYTTPSLFIAFEKTQFSTKNIDVFLISPSKHEYVLEVPHWGINNEYQ